MAALASISDVQARLSGSLSAAEQSRVRALIDDASAAIVTLTGQTIVREETTERLAVRTINRQRVVSLPQRPVNSVASVETIDGDTVSFEWDGKGKLALDAALDLAYVDVTYDHGYGDDNDPRNVIGTITGIVATVAARAFGTPAEESGKTAESIGTYSYSIGSGAAQGGFGLMASEVRAVKRALGHRRGGTIQL